MPRPDAFVTLDPDGVLPPFAQIFEQIRALIERGTLKPGEALPPVRQLAGDLGVAPNTVVRAYSDLRAEGWTTSESRKGTRVASGMPGAVKSSRRRVLGDAVVGFLTSLASRGYDESEIAVELRKRLPALNV